MTSPEQQLNLWAVRIDELESSVREIQDLRDRVEALEAVEERLNNEIEALVDELGSLSSQVREVAWEMDDDLAEHRYHQVEHAVNQLAEFVGDDEIESFWLLARLVDIRDGSYDSGSQPNDAPPHLTADDLPELEDEDEDEILDQSDDDDATDRYERTVEAMRDRVNECAMHLRRIFEYFEGALEAVQEAAECGDMRRLGPELKNLRATLTEARNGYELYEWCLAQLYTESPGSLGDVGDEISHTMTWLQSQTGVHGKT